MIDYDEEARQKAIKIKRDKGLRQDSKQHCTKIDQGLTNFIPNRAKRAIWELIQNAKDLSDKCIIEMSLSNDEFIFAHNGSPFTPDTLESLVKQVSSEEKEDPTKVGQYGTGFITTHSFGRIIHIDGSFQLDPDNNPELYVELDNFCIDRTYENIPNFIEKLKDQLMSVDDLMYKEVSRNYKAMTSLKYQLSHKYYDAEASAEYKINAKEAILETLTILPFVLTLNPTIHKISVKAEHLGLDRTYERKEEKQLDDSDLVETIVSIESSQTNTESYLDHIYSIRTANTTIILPLSSLTEYRNIDNISKLFLYYPLLGTEEFGVNFIIHSKSFIPLEKRDGIFLAEGTTETISKEVSNKELLDEAFEKIFKFIANNYSSLPNLKYLSTVKFKKNNSDKSSLNAYYTECQAKWVSKLEDLPIIETNDGFKSIKNDDGFVVFASEIFTTLLESRDSLQVVYSYASKNILLPVIDDVLDWSKIIFDWFDEDNDNYIINFEGVVKNVIETETNLLPFLEFLATTDGRDLIYTHKVIPNRELSLKYIAKELRNADEITDDLYSVTKDLIPTSAYKFVHPSYKNLLDLDEYKRDNLKDDLSIVVASHKKNFLENKALNADFLQNLIKFCSSFPTIESTSLRRKLMPIFCELMDCKFDEIIIPSLSSNENIYEYSFNYLIENIFMFISSQNQEWVKSNMKNLLIIHENIKTSKTHKDLISQYAIFPNQKYELCIPLELAIEVEIDKKLKDIYNSLYPDAIIEAKLLENSIAELYMKEKTKDVTLVYIFEEETNETIAKKINSQLENDEYKNDIVLEVIALLEEGKYIELFKNISNNKERISYEFNDPETRKKIHSLMKNGGERLDRLIEISTNENLLNLLDDENCMFIIEQLLKSEEDVQFLTSHKDSLSEIIQYARNEVERRRREGQHKEHIKEIGIYIQNIIEKELKGELEVLDHDLTRSKLKELQDGQDFVIIKDTKPIFYIEVKSRWSSDRVVVLSKKQSLCAHNHPECYAVIVVDLSRREIKEDYTPSFDSFKDDIRVIRNVGQRIQYVENPQSKETTIIELSDYSATIEQDQFKNGDSFNDFIKYLLEYLSD